MKADIGAIAAVALFAYFVVIAGLSWRGSTPLLPVANAVLASGIVLAYLVRAPGRADGIDGSILGAVTLFLGSCVLSMYPRQSFDPALAVLLYASAFFLLRGLLARDPARRLFVVGLMGLSVLLSVAIGSQMIAAFIEWWSLTGWAVAPPLDLRLRPEPWIIHYELALLLVMLYPSWWIGPLGRARVMAAMLVGLLVLATVVIAGSRTVWFAVLLAATVISVPMLRRALRWRYRKFAAGVGIVTVLASALLIPATWSVVLDRIIRAAPVLERLAIWEPAIGEWSQRPIEGLGPGSFPWILQGTGYFDTHAHAPRHPDSAAVQLIVETGLLGLAAAAVVLATVLPTLLRGRSPAATFAAVAWLAAGVSLNTAESEFLMAALVGWAAYALPRIDLAPRILGKPTTSWVQSAVLTAALVVGAAFGGTVIASAMYYEARIAAASGDIAGAAEALKVARRLDPSLALYPRQLGTAELLMGDHRAAIGHLREATDLSPSDDLAWRILGIAHAESGDLQAALSSVEEAVALQRSDPTNLLLLAQLRRAADDDREADVLLAEVVQAWPHVVAAPGWSEYVSPSTTEDVVIEALSRWRENVPSPEPLDYQPLLIGTLAGLDEATLATLPSRGTETIREAYIAVGRCDTSAPAALSETTTSDRRREVYWALRIREAELRGAPTDTFERVHQIMTYSGVLVDVALLEEQLNPLHENGHRDSSADTWGYRRSPIQWPPGGWALPSPTSGYANWHHRPTESIQGSGFSEALRGCLDAEVARSKAEIHFEYPQ